MSDGKKPVKTSDGFPGIKLASGTGAPSKSNSNTESKTSINIKPGKPITAPTDMKVNAWYYHATTTADAKDILVNGIKPGIKGIINAQGSGFYTVKDIANVYQWMKVDEDLISTMNTNAMRERYLSETFSVVMIKVLTVPKEIWDGPNEKAEVVVGKDVMWTVNGVKHIKATGQITGKAMLGDPGFEAWYNNNYRI
ncbi:hypothetical protein TWF694_011296 [Orbilia ellipsospora]|uniref:Uncharacterized protein n=1 Tax=Orbilia ellipsospora TaxID=2528407 RepID=A0AAV9X676_9PEZI